MEKFSAFFQNQVENGLVQTVGLLRVFFILFMTVYLAVSLFSLSEKLFVYLVQGGLLDFPAMKTILTDALFTLIVLAIVRSLFIRDSFVYALTFLEIAFVVVIRKLILLETVPEENWTLFILGFISTAFFVMIIYIHSHMRRWRLEDEKAEDDKNEDENMASDNPPEKVTGNVVTPPLKKSP